MQSPFYPQPNEVGAGVYGIGPHGRCTSVEYILFHIAHTRPLGV